MQTSYAIPKADGNFKIRKDEKPMKDYKKIICLTAAVCLLGAAAFCGYHIYDHYAHEAEQTEAFEEIAAIVELHRQRTAMPQKFH